jgi:hypothetical protein
MSWKGNLEGSGPGLIEALSRYLTGENEENHETFFSIAGILAEIRTEHIPNTSVQLYLYTDLCCIITY